MWNQKVVTLKLIWLRYLMTAHFTALNQHLSNDISTFLFHRKVYAKPNKPSAPPPSFAYANHQTGLVSKSMSQSDTHLHYADSHRPGQPSSLSQSHSSIYVDVRGHSFKYWLIHFIWRPWWRVMFLLARWNPQMNWSNSFHTSPTGGTCGCCLNSSCLAVDWFRCSFT